MSDIAYNTIDEDFPVQGQDNNSQGFRDNFNIIKSGLATAHSEISNLETYSAKLGTDEINDFSGGIIKNVQLKNAYFSSTTEWTNTVNAINADYFRISKSNDNQPITIIWPENTSNNYIKIRLEITASENTVVSFVGNNIKTNFVNISLIAPPATTLQGVTLTGGQIGIFDCWISDNTGKVCIQSIGVF